MIFKVKLRTLEVALLFVDTSIFFFQLCITIILDYSRSIYSYCSLHCSLSAPNSLC